MPRYFVFGGISLLGGTVMLICQAVTSLTASEELVWRDFSVLDVIGSRYLGWIEDISWHAFQAVLESVVSLPLYGCLITVGIVILVIGGIRQR